MSVVSVYAVFANAEEAERVGGAVVEARLAACVNILGHVRSNYRWNGKIESADKNATNNKTSDNDADALMTRIAGLHSYAVPCVVVWPIDKVLQSYAQWVEDNVG